MTTLGVHSFGDHDCKGQMNRMQKYYCWWDPAVIFMTLNTMYQGVRKKYVGERPRKRNTDLGKQLCKYPIYFF